MNYAFLSSNAAGGGIPGWVSFIVIAVMLAGLYFITIRPQRKQEKETKQMRDNLSVGDEIVTIGGVVGIIISISDETITIISSRDRTRIQFLKSAVSRVQVPANDDSQEKKDNKTESK